MKPSDEYIFNQPELYRSMLLHVIAVIESKTSNATLEYKYGIPYFYLNKKPFCYLAPNHKKGYLDVGFTKGFQLKKHQEYLVSKDRNTVKSLRYFSLEEINNEILLDVIDEAISLY